MGEKVYKPIIKEGDHIIHSKDNPNRVRGLTRDVNNQNPDIIEWEEYDVDEIKKDPELLSEDEGYLTPEQEEIAEKIGEAMAAIIIAATSKVFRDYISPWWENKAWPWVIEKRRNIKKAITKNKKQIEKTSNIEKEIGNKNLAVITSQIDKAFDQLYIDMDEEDAKEHLMKLIYHMLGAVNEIRIISNSCVCKNSEFKEIDIEHEKEIEGFLIERVATGLDQLLSNEKIRLDLDTSRELFSLTGGGVRINGEYIPVQVSKIEAAMKSMPPENG